MAPENLMIVLRYTEEKYGHVIKKSGITMLFSTALLNPFRRKVHDTAVATLRDRITLIYLIVMANV